jgi:long-subunit fatty acid transport protein
MKAKSVFIMLLGLLFCLTSLGSAQDGQLIAERTAGNNFGLGARAMGMGGAHIASVLDGTALVYNPAALAKIRRIEFLGGISHQSLDNNTDPNQIGSALSGFNDRGQSNTRLNTLNLSIPYPTYRGSLVFAFGLNRVKSFDKAFQVGYALSDGGSLSNYIGTESESGSLYALSAGGGIDLSPNLSVGLSLNYYFGNDNYSWRLDEGDNPEEFSPLFIDNIEDDYSAVSAKAGILFAASQHITLGAAIETPIRYEIEEQYVQRTFSGEGSDIAAGKYAYDLWTPFSFGAGIGFNLNYIHLAADINYADWTQMEYKDNPALETDNIFIQEFYRDVLSFSIGGEFLLPKLGLKLRAGYRHDPLPYSDNDLGGSGLDYAGMKVIDDRQFVTFGFGYLIDRIMTLDVAFVLGGYKIEDNETSIIEDYDLTRVFVTTGFRL